jgi:hypothetical protein
MFVEEVLLAMVKKTMQSHVLEKYELMHRMVTFVKDEGSNLMFMATTLCSIVDCHPLKLQRVYEGTCFNHIMFKVIIGLK